MSASTQGSGRSPARSVPNRSATAPPSKATSPGNIAPSLTTAPLAPRGFHRSASLRSMPGSTPARSRSTARSATASFRKKVRFAPPFQPLCLPLPPAIHIRGGRGGGIQHQHPSLMGTSTSIRKCCRQATCTHTFAATWLTSGSSRSGTRASVASASYAILSSPTKPSSRSTSSTTSRRTTSIGSRISRESRGKAIPCLAVLIVLKPLVSSVSLSAPHSRVSCTSWRQCLPMPMTPLGDPPLPSSFL